MEKQVSAYGGAAPGFHISRLRRCSRLLLTFLRRCHFPFHSPKRCVPPEGGSAMLRTHQQHERLEFALSDQRMEHTAHDIHLLAAAAEHCGGADLVAAHISLTVARTVTLLAGWPDLSAGVPN